LADVGQKSEAKNLIDTAVKEYGRLDILVNNAGIYENDLIGEMANEQWDDVIQVNLTGTFQLSPTLRGLPGVFRSMGGDSLP